MKKKKNEKEGNLNHPFVSRKCQPLTHWKWWFVSKKKNNNKKTTTTIYFLILSGQFPNTRLTASKWERGCLRLEISLRTHSKHIRRTSNEHNPHSKSLLSTVCCEHRDASLKEISAFGGCECNLRPSAVDRYRSYYNTRVSMYLTHAQQNTSCLVYTF